MNTKHLRRRLWGLLLITTLIACDQETVELRDREADGAVVGPDMDGAVGRFDGSTTPTASPDGSFMPLDAAIVVSEAGIVSCGEAPCQCANGVDDDGDGQIDGMDSECTGPTDNDEGSFATGIPGDNRDPNCQDCFFDGNSGSGDDGCRYATSCLTDGTPNSGAGACRTCEVTQRCIDFCRPATPNGCDCFGCCEIQLPGGGTRNVILGGACSIEMIEDESMCPQCVQNEECINECGRCELCPGRTAADLPADCFEVPDSGTPLADGGPPPVIGPSCDNGEQQCDATTPCPEALFCTLGCCLPTLF